MSRIGHSNSKKILRNLGIDEGNEGLFSNLALSRVKSFRHGTIAKQIMNMVERIWRVSG